MKFKKEEPGNWCPLIKKDCVEHKCAWYMHIRGMDPNTGQEIDHWGCAVGWMPTLLIENSQQQRQTGAAVESFRNETIKENQKTRNVYTDMLKQNQILPVIVNPVENLLEGEVDDENDSNRS
jgi:hypothetical protein|tara:strand:+ start:1709 stop:2074 length:366 start_codon:yes stop_codon:yes gene_type:complete